MKDIRDAVQGDHLNPPTSFRHKVIDFASMPCALRVMSAAAVTILLSIGASLLLAQVPQPHLQMPLNFNGHATQAPLVALLMLAVADGLGYVYALAGAMQLRWHLRLFVVALVTTSLGVIPALALLSSVDLLSSNALPDAWLVTQTLLNLGQVLVLAIIWVWAVAVAALRRRESAVAAPPRRHYAAAFLVAMGLIALYYGISVAIWLINRVSGPRLIQYGDIFLIDEIVAPTLIFPLILPLFIYWASTDTVEWSTTLMGIIVTRVGQLRGLLPAIVAVAALGLGTFNVLTTGSGVLSALLVATMLAAIVALVLWLGAAPGEWPAEVPVAAQLAGVVFLFAAIDVPSTLFHLLASAGWLPRVMIDPLAAITTLVIELLGIACGLTLAALGRLRRHGGPSITGLLLALEAGLVLAARLDYVQAQIGVTLVPQPKHIVAGIELFAALSLLGAISVFALRRATMAQWTALWAGALIALGGLVAIDATNTYALARLNATPAVPWVVALVFLATVIWDVVTSGQQITNKDSAAAPRSGRVLLYFGYSLVAAALFLYAAALRTQGTNAPIPQYLVGEDGATAIAGLYLLGIPLALTLGITHGWRGLALPRREATGHARFAFAGTLAAGAVIVMLVASLSATAALSHTSSHTIPSTLVYRTDKPGPNCDTRGGIWIAEPGSPTPACLAEGLQLTANPGDFTLLGFLPPSGLTSKDYHVSVRVAFDQRGCAGLTTRGSERGYYQQQICADGAWSLLRRDLSNGLPHYLAIGNVTPTPAYALDITDSGSQLTMAINSVTVASVTDTQFPDGFINLAVFNLEGSASASATFSEFVYAPMA